jgi:hypothetical protein
LTPASFIKTLLSALGTFALAISSTGFAAQPAEDATILAPIDTMFHGMTERDPAAIKAAALAGTILVLMRDGKPEQMTRYRKQGLWRVTLVLSEYLGGRWN